MTGRITALCCLLLLLVACGAPTVSTPAVTTPTLPVGQRPPPPTPDLTAVAMGTPLRSTLLAQIDAYAGALASCAPTAPPATQDVPCAGAAMRDTRRRFPEFDAYVTWRDAIWYCISDGRGGYTRINTFVYMPPTLEELRSADRLNVYVSSTPWCGVAGAH